MAGSSPDRPDAKRDLKTVYMREDSKEGVTGVMSHNHAFAEKLMVREDSVQKYSKTNKIYILYSVRRYVVRIVMIGTGRVRIRTRITKLSSKNTNSSMCPSSRLNLSSLLLDFATTSRIQWHFFQDLFLVEEKPNSEYPLEKGSEPFCAHTPD